MSSQTIFQFHSYKPVMEKHLTGAGNRGQISRAADALKCQRSYLSRVMTEEIHLTPDHAFKLATFFKFSGDVREYFLFLVDHDRAATPELRAHLKAKLADIRQRHENVEVRAKRQNFALDSLQAGYFSNWLWTAIHFLTSIPHLQNAEALADHLGLKEQSLLVYLRQLEQQGMVENRGKHWLYKSGEFHVGKDSPLVTFHHQNWRTRALVDAQDPTAGGVHYTAVQTMSAHDAEKIKAMLLDLIEQTAAVAAPSPPEELVALTCDWFRV
jgi:plasmid maintenance system antidote protein VapI